MEEWAGTKGPIKSGQIAGADAGMKKEEANISNDDCKKEAMMLEGVGGDGSWTAWGWMLGSVMID